MTYEPKVFDYASIMALNDLEPRYVVEGRVPVDYVTLLTGESEAGKSITTADMALAVASGQPFLGLETMRGPVVIIDLENGWKRSARRIQKLACGRDLPNDGIPLHVIDADKTADDEGMAYLRQVCEDFMPALLIIDPLVAFLGSNGDEDSSTHIRGIFKRLKRLASDYGTAIVVVHHPRKRQPGDHSYDRGATSRGSYDIIASCDVQLNIKARSENRTLEILKGRDGEKTRAGNTVYQINDTSGGEAIRIEMTRSEPVSKPKSSSERIQEAIIAQLTNEPKNSAEIIAKIMEQLKYSKDGCVRNEATALIKANRIVKCGKGFWKLNEELS